MSASIARRLLAMVRGREARKPEDLNLSPRELDILQWLVEGMSYKRIAEQLFISPLTVQSHIKLYYAYGQYTMGRNPGRWLECFGGNNLGKDSRAFAAF